MLRKINFLKITVHILKLLQWPFKIRKFDRVKDLDFTVLFVCTLRKCDVYFVFETTFTFSVEFVTIVTIDVVWKGCPLTFSQEVFDFINDFAWVWGR